MVRHRVRRRTPEGLNSRQRHGHHTTTSERMTDLRMRQNTHTQQHHRGTYITPQHHKNHSKLQKLM
ncbi:hypothetical protein E2C01_050970 [Portunus trituberculatus]|uniref:Uncharacterized protein n=1 Tax=Portunus trituberculatus TaxID=210409 RepID=A0A5B7GDI3_PORTR|nr:hypothetical protein [Portunus trituberculatus]